ncbi:MAG TPA: nucleotide exchange factor GrpE [Micromonosporaceae bacterium]|nr:nucleotide exchange factor GrpE [Micromonosporaceae bacterium]
MTEPAQGRPDSAPETPPTASPPADGTPVDAMADAPSSTEEAAGAAAEDAAPADTDTAAGDTAALAEEAARWRDKAAELEDRWRRAAAELDNARKRFQREVAAERARERARVAAAWLPVVDNLDRALKHAEEDPAAVIAGLRAVRDQAVSVLAALGFPRDDETQVPFDPQRHEAVQVVSAADAPPFTVLEVLRPGYGNVDEQLRPAAVIVSGEE